MTSTVDGRVVELLCSRLCHEMISPVSAIGNGIELIGDDPGDMLGEIIALIAHSSGQASQRLKFYRIAYGLGGEAAESMGLSDARALVDGMIEDEKIDLAWPAGTEPIGRTAMKVLLNAALLAMEALPRGGALRVAVEAGEGVDIAITATGEGAALREECLAALADGVAPEALTPRSVHAWFTRYIALAAGGALAVDAPSPGTVTVAAHLPRAA